VSAGISCYQAQVGYDLAVSRGVDRFAAHGQHAWALLSE
jgi:hypothetical protein